MQAAIKKAAVEAAKADLAAAQAQVRGRVAQARSQRFKLHTRSRTSTTRSPCCAERGDSAAAGKRPWQRRKPISSGPEICFRATPSHGGSTINCRRRCWSAAGASRTGAGKGLRRFASALGLARANARGRATWPMCRPISIRRSPRSARHRPT